MRINVDLVLCAGGTATLHLEGRVTAAAWCLLPGTRIYLTASREIVEITRVVGGRREGQRISDGRPCLLRHDAIYEIVPRTTTRVEMSR